MNFGFWCLVFGLTDFGLLLWPVAREANYLGLAPQALRSSRATHAQNNSSSASSTDLTPTTLTPNKRSRPEVFDEGITIF